VKARDVTDHVATAWLPRNPATRSDPKRGEGRHDAQRSPTVEVTFLEVSECHPSRTGETRHNNNIHEPPPLTENGKKIKSGLHIANTFNTYFSTMIDNRPNGSHINPVSNVNNDKFSRYLSIVTMEPMSTLNYVSVTSEEIKEIIKSLSNKNSSGYDEISSKVLKSSMPYVLSLLIHICNRSLSTGIFPSWLKYSQVHPIYEKGERSEISNYWPISILLFPKYLKVLFLIDCILI
jgi:hypothetical protein